MLTSHSPVELPTYQPEPPPHGVARCASQVKGRDKPVVVYQLPGPELDTEMVRQKIDQFNPGPLPPPLPSSAPGRLLGPFCGTGSPIIARFRM